MTRLEYFKANGTEGLNLGIISKGMFERYIRYSVLVNHIADGKKQGDAIKLTADECCCSAVQVYKAIYFFSKNGKEK